MSERSAHLDLRRVSCQLLAGLVLLLLVASAARAGYRNLILTLPSYPPTGYHVGDTVPIALTTTWEERPLAGQLVHVIAHRVAPGGRTDAQRWVFRTNAAGAATVLLELGPNDLPGWWVVTAFLATALPDGTGDGDGVTFLVSATEFAR